MPIRKYLLYKGFRGNSASNDSKIVFFNLGQAVIYLLPFVNTYFRPNLAHPSGTPYSFGGFPLK